MVAEKGIRTMELFLSVLVVGFFNFNLKIMRCNRLEVELIPIISAQKQLLILG